MARTPKNGEGRLAEFERFGLLPEHALAMRVLTAVETLHDEKLP